VPRPRDPTADRLSSKANPAGRRAIFFSSFTYSNYSNLYGAEGVLRGCEGSFGKLPHRAA
jgi:hypothetical protein